MLVVAIDFFKNKSYIQAEVLFKKLYEEARSPEIRRNALYGFACTQLALAQNDDELNEAFNLWYSWYKIPAETVSVEDPRLMEPVFEKIISRRWSLNNFGENTIRNEPTDIFISNDYLPKSPANLTGNPSPDELNQEKETLGNNRIPIREVETPNPNMEIQYLLESREKEILKLRQQLGSMEKNIKSLKNQIHAIEEIHQEIFEKKKGMRLR